MKISDKTPALTRLFDDNIESDRDTFARLIARQDAYVDKVQFGSITINGASFIALVSAASSNVTLHTLGVSGADLIKAACAYLLGLSLAGASMHLEANRLRGEVADALTRLSLAKNKRALLENDDDQANHMAVHLAMEQYKESKLAGFQYSSFSIASLNAAHASWVTGTIYLVLRMLT